MFNATRHTYIVACINLTAIVNDNDDDDDDDDDDNNNNNNNNNNISVAPYSGNFRSASNLIYSVCTFLLHI